MSDDARGLTLYEIASELHEAMESYEAAVTDEEKEHARTILAAYVEAEVRKVDGIRAYIRHYEMLEAAAKQEAQAQLERARIAANRVNNLKQFVLGTMQMLVLKKLEGRTGTLTVSGNGGQIPIEVTDESLIPDEYCDFHIRVPVPMLRRVWSTLRALGWPVETFARVVRLPDVRLALESICEPCHGTGKIDEDEACALCRGSGKQSVPGARFGERGQHLRVK